MKTKIKAALIHLAISAFIALLVILIIYGGWYQGGLASIEGVGSILLIMIGVDVVLGPLMTLLVYKPKKKTLVIDLSVIAFLQAAFLTYGVYNVELARPAFVVFEENRFETVSYADLPEESRIQLQANTNPKTSRSPFQPVYVVALPPADPILASKLLEDAIAGGAELSQMPKYYSSPALSNEVLLAKAKPIEQLKKIKGNDPQEVDTFIRSLGLSADDLKFLPLKGKSKDAVIVIEAKTATILAIGLFKPWL
jgi:hypothetical protein